MDQFTQNETNPAPKRVRTWWQRLSDWLTMSHILLTAFGVITGLILTGFFYLTPIRDAAEYKLFDLRTRIKPNTVDTSQVAVVAIDQESIHALEGPDVKDLSFGNLIMGVKAALAQKPKALVVFWYTPVFSPKAPEAVELLELATEHRNLFLGVYSRESLVELPAELLAAVEEQIVSVEVPKTDTRQVARWLHREGYENTLPFEVANYLGVDGSREMERVKEVLLNYVPPQQMLTLNLVHVITPERKGQDSRSLITDRVVTLGYTEYRQFNDGSWQLTFVNSPTESDNSEVREGIPLVFWHAGALTNLLDRRWLLPIHPLLHVFQTVAITILTLIAWRLGVGLGSLAILGIAAMWLVGQSLLMGYLDIYAQLADPFFFMTLALMVGGMRQSTQEVRERTAIAAQAESQKILAATHERFLNQFAKSLLSTNHKVEEHLLAANGTWEEGSTLARIYNNARISCNELTSYLKGFQMDLNQQSATLVTNEEFSLDSLCRELQDEFYHRADGTDHQLLMDPPPAIKLRTDKSLLTQMLVNFLSNAIKYSPAGSPVEVRWQRDRLGGLSIDITDHGSGIPLHHQRHIFEKYYRVHDDNVHRVKGHGLGLYLNHYFAQLLGAEIAVRSSTGGSTFSIILAKELVCGK